MATVQGNGQYFEFGGNRVLFKDAAGRGMIAPEETSSTASKAYAIGEAFIYNNLIYRATAAIAQGGTITPGTNCETVPGGIGGEVGELKSAINEVLEIETVVSKNLNKTPIPSSETVNGLTFTRNSDRSVTMTNSPSSKTYWPTIVNDAKWLLPAGTYTLSGGRLNMDVTLLLYANKTDSSVTETKISGSSSTTFTTDQDYWAWIRFAIASGASTNGVTLYPQLEAGSQATSYQDPNYEKTISGVIDGINDSLDDIENTVKQVELQTIGWQSENLFSGYTDGYYWNSNGTQTSSSSWAASDAISVSDFYSIVYSGIGEPGSNPKCLWLDSSDNVLEAFTPKQAGETLIIPENAVKIEFSIRAANVSGFAVYGKTFDNLQGINDNISDVRGEIADIYGQTSDISNLAGFENGGINSTTGEFRTDYPYRVTTPEKITLAHSINVSIASGFRLYVFVFDAQGGKASADWHTSNFTIEEGTICRLMIARVTETSSETADIETFCSKITYKNVTSIKTLQEQIDTNDAAIPYGIAWDWWITANSVDGFGNVYIGYIDSDQYAGVLRRQPDGTMQYKRLERSYDDDDHNAMATAVLPDGRILVIGSYGHTINNHIICWRSVKPYSIDEMEDLSFDIPQTGGYTYKTCYSQVYQYDGKLFNFMRFGSSDGVNSYQYGVACLISSDNGNTWSVYKVFNNPINGYCSYAHATDNSKYLKVVCAQNPSGGNCNLVGCYIDLSTYKVYDLSDSEIGEMVALNNGSIIDEGCAQYSDMTFLIEQTVTGKKGRLFYTAKTPLANTMFLFATATDSTDTDYTYKRYSDGTVLVIGSSGAPFGNVHYICGECFGKDNDTVYYAKATTAEADGNHELHKVKINAGAVASDEIITEASMSIIRPLYLGNGEVAVSVGHYNDEEHHGYFLRWELKPLFTHA